MIFGQCQAGLKMLDLSFICLSLSPVPHNKAKVSVENCARINAQYFNFFVMLPIISAERNIAFRQKYCMWWLLFWRFLCNLSVWYYFIQKCFGQSTVNAFLVSTWQYFYSLFCHCQTVSVNVCFFPSVYGPHRPLAPPCMFYVAAALWRWLSPRPWATPSSPWQAAVIFFPLVWFCEHLSLIVR